MEAYLESCSEDVYGTELQNASLLGSLALCGKLPCDFHAVQVEVKAAFKNEGKKKTLYGGRRKALDSIRSSPLEHKNLSS